MWSRAAGFHAAELMKVTQIQPPAATRLRKLTGKQPFSSVTSAKSVKEEVFTGTSLEVEKRIEPTEHQSQDIIISDKHRTETIETYLPRLVYYVTRVKTR